MIKGIADACRRGIVVTVYVGLGFNDFAEAVVPFQGGSNVEVLEKLQAELKADGPDILRNLEWHWYTAKDQVKPVRFEKQARNCHVKFMNVDDEVAIMGSGNQDTQVGLSLSSSMNESRLLISLVELVPLPRGQRHD